MILAGPPNPLPDIQEFLDHWAAVNGSMSTGEVRFVVPGDSEWVGRETLRKWHDDLTALAEKIARRHNDRTLCDSVLRQLRDHLHGRLDQFNRRVREVLGRSRFARGLPQGPPLSASSPRFFAALESMLDLWNRLHTAHRSGELPELSGPLLLPNRYSRKAFQGDLIKFHAVCEESRQIERELKRLQTLRDRLQARVYAAMQAYGNTIRGELPRSDTLVVSLPRLRPVTASPVQRGITPLRDRNAVESWEEGLAG